MTTQSDTWRDTLLGLLALARALEDEGQYNLAKLLRAAADSMGRRAAFELGIGRDKDALLAGIERSADQLARLDLDRDLVAALRHGAAALAEGRLPLIDETPHPYVCRTCGHLAPDSPATVCPVCGAWPDTFQRFMPIYWLDALEPFAAMTRLRATPGEVSRLLDGLPPEALLAQPADGGWAIQNVVTHLRDAQNLLDFRLDLFMAEEHPRLDAKAVWSYAKDPSERPLTTEEIFEVYRASRARSLAKLEALPLERWYRTGEHQEFGAVTLRQQASYFAAHETTHLSQIAALRRRFAPEG